jgi:hypothetical protein
MSENFIFVNSGVYSGEFDKNKNELCRPLVDYILGQLHGVTTIEELIDQIILKPGKLQSW